MSKRFNSHLNIELEKSISHSKILLLKFKSFSKIAQLNDIFSPIFSGRIISSLKCVQRFVFHSKIECEKSTYHSKIECEKSTYHLKIDSSK